MRRGGPGGGGGVGRGGVARDAGTAVLLVSAELDEVLEMSDRIGVMYGGRIVAVVDGRTADKNEVGLLMATGGAEREAAAPVEVAS